MARCPQPWYESLLPSSVFGDSQLLRLYLIPVMSMLRADSVVEHSKVVWVEWDLRTAGSAASSFCSPPGGGGLWDAF